MLPKKGITFPEYPNSDIRDAYATAIARALSTELGNTHQAVKTVMAWTGAGERTAKNWFAGTSGPSGEHLLTLVRNSDQVLEVFLRMAGRKNAMAATKLVDLREKLTGLVTLIDESFQS